MKLKKGMRVEIRANRLKSERGVVREVRKGNQVVIELDSGALRVRSARFVVPIEEARDAG